MKKIFAFFCLFIVVLGVILCSWAQKKVALTSLNEKTILLEVPAGGTSQTLFKTLKTLEIWEDDLAFRLWLKLNPGALNLKVGWYEIPPHVSLDEIAIIVSSGISASKKVTIPEGRASWEMPAYLKKAFPSLDSNTWNALIHDAQFAASLGVSAKSLEGYLLPDTYPFPINADEKTIIKQMVKANLKLRDELLSDSAKSMWKDLGSWHKVLTLASVVEEETGIPEERPLIAGVFHNRLKIGMPLGADPTVRFIFKNLTGPIYKRQLNSDNPYNTRKFKGLMPGPISNPGRKAIEATLHPSETKALYFVAKDDGSMTHFFSTNLNDHNKYKNVAAKNRGE